MDTSWEARSKRLLADAGIALASSLDYQTTLTTIANLAVTDFAEWCSVDVLEDSGELDKVVIAHADTARVHWAEEFAAKYPTDLNSSTGLSAVLHSGESLWVSQVDETMLARTARSPGHLADLKSIGVGSVMLTALKAGGKTLGVVTYIHSEPGHFESKHLKLAEELSHLAALALDNARLYTQAKRELEARLRISQELTESELRFRELADAMPVIVWVMHPAHGVTFTNRQYQQYCGMGEEGKGDSGWALVVHPEDREAARATYVEAIQRGAIWEQDLRLRRHDGEYRWHLSRAVPALDADGKILHWYGTSTDIHEQKVFAVELERQVELRTRELQEALDRAEKFDYSIAHDLRAPLRAIVATSKILQEEVGPQLSGATVELLERQATNALKLSRLIDDLLQLSHLARAELTLEPLDLTEIASLVAEGLPESKLQKFEIEEELRCLGDRHQVTLLVECLFGNAVKFSCGGPVRMGRKGNAFFISDEGIGFDMEYASKVFLPFERLVSEEQFPGTGAGLAIAQRIVSRHHGAIWIEAAPRQGTTVYFQLPPAL